MKQGDDSGVLLVFDFSRNERKDSLDLEGFREAL